MNQFPYITKIENNNIIIKYNKFVKSAVTKYFINICY